MLVAGQAELVDEGAGGWAGELVDVGSRVGAWRRLRNGTLDLVLVGVPRAVTGPLPPTVLAEGSPETTGIPQCWKRVAPRLLAVIRMPPSNGGGGRTQSHGQDAMRRELRTEAWISH